MRVAWLTAAVLALLPAGAAAQVQPPGTGDPGGFYNVLGVGQGGSVTAAEVAAHVAAGDTPASFTNQLALYRDLGPLAPSVDSGNLSQFFKSAGFGVEEARVVDTITPRSGVVIQIDDLNVPHVYGNTRSDVHFGAGYATGLMRMFQMDVLRHYARGTLAAFAGPGSGNSNLEQDVTQLRGADYTEAELQEMIDTAAASAGQEGAEVKQDLDAYVDGINAYISDVRGNPLSEPGEYALLGQPLEDWKPTDTAAVASLIGGIFGRGGGMETRGSAVLSAARARFGRRRGDKVFRDFRSLNDPEAPVTTPKRFPFPDPRGSRRRLGGKGAVVIDPGSLQEYDIIASGRPAASSSRATPRAGGLSDLIRGDFKLSGPASNATLVRAADSVSGKPLAVTGPQVGYYSPEILFEIDMHGGGVDVRGVAFPGVSLYVLLGRGKDFSWSATTATTDNVDQFVEVLCEPDGSAPTRSSVHYRYKGECIPMKVQERTVTTPGPSPADTEASPQPINYRLLRTVHGPVQSTATVKGRPVAITSARSTYFHELESALAFKRLNRNEVTDAQSFQDTMATINFLFNWFYNDERDIAYLQSGWFPLRARGTDPSLPTLGDGRFDWRGFNPADFTSQRAGINRLPKDINPARGFIVSWNNKQAPGWRAADDVWSFNSVQRSERLEDRVRGAIAGPRKLDLPGLVSIMGNAGTVDLRGQEVWPWARRVIRKPGGATQLVNLLDRWVAAGSHRVDRNGDNFYEHSPAVALMDAWWTPLIRAIYQPILGEDLIDRIRAINTFHQAPGPGGSAFFDGWYGYVEKDLRTVFGAPVRGRYSRRYCGGGSLKRGRGFNRRRRRSLRRCRATLLSTLKQAKGAAEARYGTPLEQIRVPATCDDKSPPACDQITFTATGGIETEPIPWQDRGTFQQAVEVQGDRP